MLARKAAITESFLRNARTTFWPLIDSSITPFSSPRSFCSSRKPLRVYLATNWVNQNMIGTTSREASASQRSRMNMVIRIPTMVRTLASREVTFCETAWLMASISLVRRLISSPAGLWSKKAIDRLCRCVNRSLRICLRARCEMPAMIQLAMAWNRLFNKYTANIHSAIVARPATCLVAINLSIAWPIK